MEACSFSDIAPSFDQTVAHIATAQGVDPICSTSHWMIPVAQAFSDRAPKRVFTSQAGHVALIEHEHPTVRSSPASTPSGVSPRPLSAWTQQHSSSASLTCWQTLISTR